MEGTEQPHHNDFVYALKDEKAYLQADDEKPEIVEPFDPASIVCQFCGKSLEQVQSLEQVPGFFQAKRLARDPNTSALAQVWICDECVARMRRYSPRRPQELNGSEGGRSGHITAVPPTCPNHRSAAVIHGQPRSMPMPAEL